MTNKQLLTVVATLVAVGLVGFIVLGNYFVSIAAVAGLLATGGIAIALNRSRNQ